MGDAEVTASSWRLVEVGRVVVFAAGQYAGRLAAIVQIIDHKRVLVDGPSENESRIVPRHATPLSHISLSPIVIPKLPFGIGNGPLKKKWQEAKVDEQFDQSAWAKSRVQRDRRRKLTDFERFKVMRLKKQVRFEQKKALAKIKAAA